MVTQKKGVAIATSLKSIKFVLPMYKQLTREQRYTIYVLLHQKQTKKEIAKAIGVNESTVYRELKRNSSDKHHVYNWAKADVFTKDRRERMKRRRTFTPEIRKRVVTLLQTEQWSPKQISGSLKLNEGISISHESIYRLIREDRGAGGVLYQQCRHKLKYHHHVIRHKATKVKNIQNRVSIHDRPVEADGRRFGDWEMDLIVGKRHKDAILTMCERSTNMFFMCKLNDGKKAQGVSDAVISLLLPYKRYVKTITTDNGSEFALHEKISKALHTQVYFADSYASWQKGAVENTNKLIRQYIPKGVDFSLYSDEDIKKIQYKINRRPREKLNFSTPKKEFYRNISKFALAT